MDQKAGNPDAEKPSKIKGFSVPRFLDVTKFWFCNVYFERQNINPGVIAGALFHLLKQIYVLVKVIHFCIHIVKLGMDYTKILP